MLRVGLGFVKDWVRFEYKHVKDWVRFEFFKNYIESAINFGGTFFCFMAQFD